jgi:organic radical activating enzyme
MIIRDYLEAEIVGFCNLRCGQCSHHSPFINNCYYEIDQFTRDVKELAKVLHVREFRLLGGEPFLAKSVSEYVFSLRDSGITERIGICTNGTLLDRLDIKLLNHIDYLDISLYPLDERLNKKILMNIKKIKYAYPEKIRVMVINEFRYSNIVFENKDQDCVSKIWENCKNRKRCHAIYNGYYFICMASQRKGQFLKAVFDNEKPLLSNPDIDGICIDNYNFEEKLGIYINRQNPLYACKWCLGSSGRKIRNLQNAFELITDPFTLKDYLELWGEIK